jgi:hypothetical protein
MVLEGPLQWCRLSSAARRSHMSAQNPVGVIPASKSVRRTIEVAVLRGTVENCTLDCMRRANLRHGNTGRRQAAVRLGSEDEPGRYCEVVGPRARCRRPRHLGCFRCSSVTRRTHPAVSWRPMPPRKTLNVSSQTCRLIGWRETPTRARGERC